MSEHVDHILGLERLFLFGRALKVFGLVEFTDADADEQRADGAHAEADPAGGREEALVVLAAEHRQQHDVEDHAHDHGDEVVHRRRPHADGRALLGIVGHDGGQGLGRHVGDGVADDVDDVHRREGEHAKSLAGEEIEHAQKTDGFDGKAADHQNAQLAPAGVDAVIDEGEQRVGDAVQNTGAGEDDADDGGGDAVADAGAVAGHADKGVYAHADKGVAGL